MNKFSNLLKIAELFYKKAMRAFAQTSYVSPDDNEDVPSNLTKEDFDIKNEFLFNQFDAFYELYDELDAIINMTEDKISPKDEEEVIDLGRALESKLKQIMDNPYINENNPAYEASYEEDFSPEDLKNVLVSDYTNLTNRLSSKLSDDFTATPTAAEQQFYEQQEKADLEGKTEQWGANKRENKKNPIYRYNWWTNLLADKKRYAKYLTKVRTRYSEKMKDPEIRKEYRAKSRKRQEDFFKGIDWANQNIFKAEETLSKLEEREKELIEKERNAIYQETKDSVKETLSNISGVKQSLILKIKGLKSKIENKSGTTKKTTIKRKQLTELNVPSLERSRVSLSDATKTKKMRLHKAAILAAHKEFEKTQQHSDLKAEISSAQYTYDKEPSTENKAKLDLVNLKANKIIDDYVNNHKSAVIIRDAQNELNTFHKRCKLIFGIKGRKKNEEAVEGTIEKILAAEAQPFNEEQILLANTLIEEANTLKAKYSKYYNTSVPHINNIIKFLEFKINEVGQDKDIEFINSEGV
jgi:hypothetical protein